MRTTTCAFDYSPSLVHQRLADRTVPGGAYGGGPVADWQDSLRASVQRLLGLDLRQGDRLPLDVRPLWKQELEVGTIEKLAFRTEAGADVPAYICLPRTARPPYTFCVCLQGHTSGMHNSVAAPQEDDTRIDSIPADGDRDFALSCMRHGMAAFCIEQRSFGERRETHLSQPMDYLCHQAAAQALILGTTLLAERVFDVDRALDYLETRSDVDWPRVGIMGNSGGGTVALFAAALLPRIRFAMPSCCFSTYRESLMATFHCICNYIPGMSNVADMGDIAGLIAPRPLVIVAGRNDGIFPLRGARSEFDRVKSVYAKLGATANCHLLVGDGGHRFYADLAWPVLVRTLGESSATTQCIN